MVTNIFLPVDLDGINLIAVGSDELPRHTSQLVGVENSSTSNLAW
jgi:hypothetical protein